MGERRALAATSVVLGSFALLGACSSTYGSEVEPPPPATPSAEGGADVVVAHPVEASLPDDSGVDAGPGCNGEVDCERVVFVSSHDFPGALGGLEGADTQCQTLADASLHERVKGRRFMAWLSTSTQAAAARLPHGIKPYVLPSGERVAADWTALTGGGLERPIDVDETGSTITSQRAVWTGTRPDGTSGTFDCSGWAQNDSTGVRGRNDADNKEWTDQSIGNCANTCRIYCFEH